MDSATLDRKGEQLKVLLANRWLSRLVGLLRFNRLDNNTGLLLVPCGSIHTMWMRFSIDVLFLDKEHKVLKIEENVRPFRFRMAPSGTWAVLELAAFNAKRLGFHVNESIQLKHL